MAELKDFDVMRVARSDGSDTGPGYWPTPATNATKKATKDVLTAATRQKPHMVRLEESDPRFVEWRVKLGILLKQELAPNPEDGNPWYLHFPKGYWLYEKSKHLWVSGYPIKGKLYKSPQEFGLHLVWLMTASMDYRDCCCIHCNVPEAPAKQPSPPDPVVKAPASAAPPKAPLIPHKVTPVPLPRIPGQSQEKQVAGEAQSQPGRSQQPATADPSVSVAPAITPQPGSQGQARTGIQIPQIQAQPTSQVQPQVPARVQPPVQPKTQQQNRPVPRTIKWALQAPMLFRAGELVWYQNGNSWRLGIISSPGFDPYTLVPIGYAEEEQPEIEKPVKEMRPFQAFSVPAVMIAELRDKMFDHVAWGEMFQRIRQDRPQRNNLLLDASKLAAAKIDASYSLWSPLAEEPSIETTHYYGCFFGAERIEIGDCIRVKLPADNGSSRNGPSVLGLCSIVLRRTDPPAIRFRGNMYKITKGDDETGVAIPIDNLPITLQAEMRWRNQSKQPWRWVLMKEDVLLDEKAVCGRFYPTHQLMPLLNEAGFNEAIAKGDIEGQYPYLNNRMDGSSVSVGCRVNRLDMLGKSVPKNTKIVLEPPIRELAGVSG
ncbi:hypothetical protein DCS_00706 [Drechmeria coniospora]|uniref:Transcription-silencing protein Clr2 n=1 Tax=Drechmeria coniospora TaxID=98403 RepID=A0A151GR22_DRECN|nr:hypothetical protein DCS_00706 [Drechmeria coniospora]KYK59574.1 hypothetical protein DCS_00706 [Drechmeria coniospora]ODA76736.1 hypothetical protein RJ55_08007 [Drechmeria coniospora]